MAAFTTMALVGASVMGAVGSAVAQRNSRKAQEKALRDQEEAARIAAANAAALQNPSDQVADVSLGRGTATTAPGALNQTTAAAVQTGSVASRVGGLNRRASSGVGL